MSSESLVDNCLSCLSLVASHNEEICEVIIRLDGIAIVSRAMTAALNNADIQVWTKDIAYLPYILTILSQWLQEHACWIFEVIARQQDTDYCSLLVPFVPPRLYAACRHHASQLFVIEWSLRTMNHMLSHEANLVKRRMLEERSLYFYGILG